MRWGGASPPGFAMRIILERVPGKLLRYQECSARIRRCLDALFCFTAKCVRKTVLPSLPGLVALLEEQGDLQDHLNSFCKKGHLRKSLKRIATG